MHPREYRERALQLRLQGWGYSEIGEELGIDTRNVTRWLPPDRYPLTPEQQVAHAERASLRLKQTKRRSLPTPAAIPGVLWVRHRGQWIRALVDLDDWQAMRDHRWSLSGGRNFSGDEYAAGKGYPTTQINGKSEYLHRMLFGLKPGARWPDGERIIIDHRNRDTLDNRRANLHVGTQKENCANRGGIFEKSLRAA